MDYEDTFSPIAWFEIVRTLLEVELTYFQFNVKYAFLNGELKEEVYVSQPEGFVVHGKNN